MRSDLKKAYGELAPEHFGLAYDAWADTDAEEKITKACLERLVKIEVAEDYRHAFNRWKGTFEDAQAMELALGSRLLVGHGNPSASEVGLTVHHTWAVPVIPGSALKGLLAHYVSAVHGPADPSTPPWHSQADRERAPYQGVTWDADGKRILRGPGETYRDLFGAPDADEDLQVPAGFRAHAAAGLVEFHDALYVPLSAKDDRPFAIDVLTVHQKEYYKDKGKCPPTDYYPPVPVSFLTVRPGCKFLVALTGPADWVELAMALLRDALKQWGVGGKTSAGYGRLQP